MKFQYSNKDSHRKYSDANSKTIEIDDDSIVVLRNEVIDLPKRCIHCCTDVFLNRKEQEINSRQNDFSKAEALVSYYSCQEHSKDEEKNGFLLVLWIVLNIFSFRFIPFGIASAILLGTGIYVLYKIRQSQKKLLVKKYKDDRFWVTGVSDKFLNYLKSNIYANG